MVLLFVVVGIVGVVVVDFVKSKGDNRHGN